jgi:hypothetical protein
LSTCPVCFQSVTLQESDFGGIFVCPSCNGSFFVSLLGEPMTPEASQQADVPFESSETLQSLLVDEIQESGVANQEMGAGNEFLDVQKLEDFEPHPEIQFLTDSPVSTPDSAVKAPQVIVNQFPNAVGNNDLTAMNDFANSPDISLPLKYDLLISGIDTELEVEILREALTDQRLALDRIEIFDTMKNGQARIHNLNPVKAAILFERLRYEPFVIEVVEKTI